jgi:hypothetical protein
MSAPSRRHESGMALPMVLWSIALLTGIVLLLAGIIEGWLSEETRLGKLFRARQQALSGIAVAMNPGVFAGDPLLNQFSKDGSEGYQVAIKDESGLINPNYFLAQTPDQRSMLGQLFTAWKLDKNSSDAAADGLYDWQSQSPFRSLHGAKKEDYAAVGMSGLPPGAPFASPEEMELVIGFDSVVQAKPDWVSNFTTYYNGPVNILRAPKNILVELLGLLPSQADNWIALRTGKDGIEGTDDDLKPTSITNAISLIGVNGAKAALIGRICTTTGSVRRIESTGICNGVKQRITVIAPTGSTQNPQGASSVLGWSEQ